MSHSKFIVSDMCVILLMVNFLKKEAYMVALIVGTDTHSHSTQNTRLL